jgi:hypothetical protein
MGGRQSVRNWLCTGTDIPSLTPEGDSLWQEYSAKVKDLVLDPRASSCLDYDINDMITFDVAQNEDARSESRQTGWFRSWWLRGRSSRRPTERELEDGRGGNLAITPLRNLGNKTIDVLRTVGEVMFIPTSLLVYILNISSAFAYLMLVNTPVFQKSSSLDKYWKM